MGLPELWVPHEPQGPWAPAHLAHVLIRHGGYGFASI